MDMQRVHSDPGFFKGECGLFPGSLHKADKLTSGDVTGKDFKRPVKMKELVDICCKDQSQCLWDALAKHFYWRAMEMLLAAMAR